jgi:cation diffusion facilitator CzcD-associated flavoprotein CzcO
VPDADLFKAMRRGQARVVTDEIERFTPAGIRLKSGQELPADLIVTATGLELLALGGIQFEVDGKPVPVGKTVGYRGMMLAGLPNLACVAGYINASWTLRADLTSRYLCRLLQHMRRRHWDYCTPVLDDARVQPRPWMDLSSGYIQRAVSRFPQQGNRSPWQMETNYLREMLILRLCRLEDGSLRFGRAGTPAGATERAT